MNTYFIFKREEKNAEGKRVFSNINCRETSDVTLRSSGV